MGVAIPQVITSDRASSAQVIDGSLKFTDNTKLERTPGSSGNQKTFTWSAWVKRCTTDTQCLFGAGETGTGGVQRAAIQIVSSQLNFFSDYDGSTSTTVQTTRVLRDLNSFYHIVVSVDVTQSTSSDRVKFYINGTQVTDFSSSNYPSNNNTAFNNSSRNHIIGLYANDGNDFNGHMSQVYFIDGYALGPEQFGFTDPLTNTWKPKAFITNLGTIVNNGTVWSDSWDGTGSTGTVDNAARAFNGDLTNYTSNQNSNTICNWVPSSPIPVKRSLRVYAAAISSGNNQVFVNGTSLGTIPGSTPQWFSIQDATELTSVGLQDIGATHGRLYAIEVDGVILVDSSTSNSTDATYPFGTNGFYLPMDGNSPIGQDKSGQGNNFTPVNFGGSVALDNPQVSGARPVLNTTQGGTQAGVGVFGSKQNVGYAVTVYDDGGGNKYYIDGVKQATLTGLIRGATYTFDTSDSTVSSHPFRFSTTTQEGGGSATLYSNGVAAITGTATTITIPYDAPESLYYYCTSHSGMGSSITGITTNEKLADQFASNCVLALPLVGSKDDVSASIACTSSTEAITSNGDAAASNAQSNFYSGSFYFDGTGDYVITAANTDDLVINTGDFTLEAWIWNDLTGTYQGILSDRPDGGGGTSINITNGNKIEYYAAGTIYNTTFNVPQQSWHHVAFTRQSGTMYSFFDGVLLDSRSATSDNGDNAGIWNIGRYYYNRDGYYYKGYIQDARIYQGAAKYTSDFVVPSRSPDILPDTPSGVSGSSKLTKITDGAVAFDGTGDYLGLANTTDVNFGSGDFTWECFAYFHTVTGSISLMGQWENSTNRRSWLLQLNDGKMQSYLSSSGSAGGDAKQADSPANYMTANRWYHIAVTRSGDDMNLFIDGELLTTTDLTGFTVYANTDDGFSIGSQKSSASNVMNGFISNARIIKGTALYTSRFTPPSAPLTNVTNTKLLCCQSPSNVKLSPVAPTVGTTANTRFNSNFESIPTTVNSLTVTNNGSVSTTSAGTNSYGFTNCADLDGSNSLSVNLGAIPQVSTYDIIFKVTGTTDNKYLFAISNTGLVRRTGSSLAWYNNNGDQTISTTPDDGEWHHLRVTPKSLYFDGVETQTTSTNPNIMVTSNGYMALGAYRNDSGTIQYNGAVDIGLVRVMPGVDLGAPSSIPITTNGTLSSTETIPNDGVIFAAANAAAINFNPFNTDINTVRGQETGYPTLNPLNVSGSSGNKTSSTLSNGNLTSTNPGSNAWNCRLATVGVDSGKWYYEYTVNGSISNFLGGWADSPNLNFADAVGNTSRSYAYYNTGNVRNSNNNTSFGSTYTVGDVIGCAIDLDNYKIYWSKNGVWQNSANPVKGTQSIYTVTSGYQYFPAVSTYDSNSSVTVNFGQNSFSFPPPDGFQALNDANTRPVKVISRPDQYVGVTTYSGSTGTGTIKDDNINFTPDFVWVKDRGGTEVHALYDTVRGSTGGNFYRLSSNNTNGNNSPTNELTSMIRGGFTTNNNGHIYYDGKYYVSWMWKAGGNKNTFNVDDVGYATAAAAGLDGGTITPSGASVGTKQGFSIISYTANGSSGATYSHGLTETPSFVITKRTNGTPSWIVHHQSFGTAKELELDGTNAASSRGDFSGMSSTLITLSSSANVNNDDSSTYISYIWHDIPGLQKFGVYEGNEDTGGDGPFVELGFRPAIIWIKNIDQGTSAADWVIYDSERNKFNPSGKQLYPNRNVAEADDSNHQFDILSNGFKVRSTSTSDLTNATDTYIYCAWAESPTDNLYGGGANAR